MSDTLLQKTQIHPICTLWHTVLLSVCKSINRKYLLFVPPPQYAALIEDGDSKCMSADSLFGDAKCCSCVPKCAPCEAAVGLCGVVNATLDTKGAQQKGKCQSPPESEPITGCERRQRCLCACCCVRAGVCVCASGRGEREVYKAHASIHWHYQHPEPVANHRCSGSTRRQLTNDCFLYAKTDSNSALSDLISYPFCHSLTLTGSSLFIKPTLLYFYWCLYLLFFLLSAAPSLSLFFEQ